MGFVHIFAVGDDAYACRNVTFNIFWLLCQVIIGNLDTVPISDSMILSNYVSSLVIT